MCLTGPVGTRGNRYDDVKTVQVLLNMNLNRLIPLAPLEEGGAIGDGTRHAIEVFQRRIVQMREPDVRVDPGGSTLRHLRDGIPGTFTQDVLQGIMIRARRSVVENFHGPLVEHMADRNINTGLRKAHFLAQLAHESGDLRYTEEIASGDAYEGRADLGNTESGDGRRFKGRGLIQLTGRANYVAYGDAIGVDLTTDAGARTVATDTNRAVDVACWYWETHNLNSLADNDNVTAITRVINGGLNGIDDRRYKLTRTKFFLRI